MKRTAVALVLGCAILTTQARADDASKHAKVEELFTVMHVDRMTEQVTASVRKQMEQSMQAASANGTMTPEQKHLLDDYENRVMLLVRDTMSWKAMEPQMVDLYMSTYSEGEIDGILAFYKGPVGQSMLAKTPELTERSMALTQAKLAALQPKISEMADEFVKQFSAAGSVPERSGTGPKGSAAPAAPKK